MPPVVASAKSDVSTPLTDSENVAVNWTDAAFVGLEPTRVIELTVGGVVSGGLATTKTLDGLNEPVANPVPVAVVTVEELVAPVHDPEVSLRTRSDAVSAPASRSPATKVKVVLYAPVRVPPGVIVQ